VGQGKNEITAEDETKKVYLDDMPNKAVIIGANLSAEEYTISEQKQGCFRMVS
jgi:hypothetical protein